MTVCVSCVHTHTYVKVIIVEWLSFTECLLNVRHSAKHSTCFIEFHPSELSIHGVGTIIIYILQLRKISLCYETKMVTTSSDRSDLAITLLVPKKKSCLVIVREGIWHRKED